jgi:uncharacterized protein (DUF2147 family)
MRKLVLIAAMLMASASAHAGGFSFNVEGQKVQIQIPRGCSSLSCINVTAPGLTDKLNKDDTSSTTTTTAPAPAPAPVATAPTAAPAPAPQAVATAPVAAPPANDRVTVLPAPAEATAQPSVSAPQLTAPQVSLQPAPAPVAAPAPAPAPTQMVATAPVAPPVAAPAPVAAANTPVGVWLTEKKEGQVRVVECGANLCGYEIKKDGSNGAQVLHNMKPGGDKWNGRITDTRNGNSYSSKIAMRGNDKLRVEGCMFGFCDGQTWSRVQ